MQIKCNHYKHSLPWWQVTQIQGRLLKIVWQETIFCLQFFHKNILFIVCVFPNGINILLPVFHLKMVFHSYWLRFPIPMFQIFVMFPLLVKYQLLVFILLQLSSSVGFLSHYFVIILSIVNFFKIHLINFIRYLLPEVLFYKN